MAKRTNNLTIERLADGKVRLCLTDDLGNGLETVWSAEGFTDLRDTFVTLKDTTTFITIHDTGKKETNRG